jgi:curved DNA-binding protein CbpA
MEKNRLDELFKQFGGDNIYGFLGIDKTDDEERIQKAYKKMIKKYHPDKNKDPGAAEIFSKIKKAIEVLKDQDLKALYDSYVSRKEEGQKRKKEYNKERRKFADDLKEREKKTNKEGGEGRGSSNANRHTPMDVDDFEPTFKKKTFEEKLQSTGVKVKWKKDSDVLITREMLYSYFKEYGSIEDIQICSDDSKAYILFLSLKSVDSVVNDNSNVNLRKLFRVKKFSNKNKDQNEYEKEKFKYLDTSTLNAIRNFNLGGVSRVEEIKKSDTRPTSTGSSFDPLRNLESVTFDKFEEYERLVLEKLKNKFIK